MAAVLIIVLVSPEVLAAAQASQVLQVIPPPGREIRVARVAVGVEVEVAEPVNKVAHINQILELLFLGGMVMEAMDYQYLG